jgi:gamma-glutamyltranspeptidase/glutathione hydrolase
MNVSGRKTEIRSRRGLVAAQHRYAAEAGAAVLARGGNAMDAAVVAALVLSVVEPWLSGIGGGGFLLHADGLSGAVSALDFNVRAPAALDPADYPLAEADTGNWFQWPSVVEDRNLIGGSSICVPGAVAGLAAALERFGSIGWAEALAPAIDHAERGLEIDWYAAFCISIEAHALARFAPTAALLLDGTEAPKVAEGRHRPMPAKARMLRRLAQAGARDFYEGETARDLAADLAEAGSRITASDLAAYQPRWAEPLRGAYRGRDIWAMPGLSGGPSLLQALDLLAPRTGWGEQPDARAALAYARAAREAYRRRLTGMGHAGLSSDPGCTSHVSVVDAQGNMVSLTNTLLSRFGSKVVLPRAGMLMNNGMMWFDPRPDQPNSMAGSAQPLANMCPLILGRDGRPELAIGAAGGRSIFPALLQLISYLVDYGMTLEEAFHTPRVDASTPTIKVNAAAAPDVAAAVARDFPVQIVEDTLYPVNFAIASAASRDPETGETVGMAHPTSPWSGVAVGGPADAG